MPAPGYANLQRIISELARLEIREWYHSHWLAKEVRMDTLLCRVISRPRYETGLGVHIPAAQVSSAPETETACGRMDVRCTHGSVMGITAWMLNVVSRVCLLPDPSANSPIAMIGMGPVGWSGIPTSLDPSSHLSQGGNVPGGDLNVGLIVSDAACGSQILGSHSYLCPTRLRERQQKLRAGAIVTHT